MTRGDGFKTIAAPDPDVIVGRPNLNDAGTVVFHRFFNFEPGEELVKGNGGPLTVIADTTGPFQSFGHFFGFQAPALNNHGDVAFFAELDSEALAGPRGDLHGTPRGQGSRGGNGRPLGRPDRQEACASARAGSTTTASWPSLPPSTIRACRTACASGSIARRPHPRAARQREGTVVGCPPTRARHLRPKPAGALSVLDRPLGRAARGRAAAAEDGRRLDRRLHVPRGGRNVRGHGRVDVRVPSPVAARSGARRLDADPDHRRLLLALWSVPLLLAPDGPHDGRAQGPPARHVAAGRPARTGRHARAHGARWRPRDRRRPASSGPGGFPPEESQGSPQAHPGHRNAGRRRRVLRRAAVRRPARHPARRPRGLAVLAGAPAAPARRTARSRPTPGRGRGRCRRRTSSSEPCSSSSSRWRAGGDGRASRAAGLALPRRVPRPSSSSRGRW